MRRVARLMGGGNGMLARGIESAAWRPVRGEVMRRFGCALGVTCGGGDRVGVGDDPGVDVLPAYPTASARI